MDEIDGIDLSALDYCLRPLADFTISHYFLGVETPDGIVCIPAQAPFKLLRLDACALFKCQQCDKWHMAATKIFHAEMLPVPAEFVAPRCLYVIFNPPPDIAFQEVPDTGLPNPQKP